MYAFFHAWRIPLMMQSKIIGSRILEPPPILRSLYVFFGCFFVWFSYSTRLCLLPQSFVNTPACVPLVIPDCTYTFLLCYFSSLCSLTLLLPACFDGWYSALYHQSSLFVSSTCLPCALHLASAFRHNVYCCSSTLFI